MNDDATLGAPAFIKVEFGRADGCKSSANLFVGPFESYLCPCLSCVLGLVCLLALQVSRSKELPP